MQTPDPSDFKKAPPRGMLSRAAAIQKATAILKKCGIMPLPPAQVRYLDYPHSAYCEVYWVDFMVALSVPGYGLVRIENHRRLQERENGNRRSGPFQITSDGQARDRIMSYARGGGVPPTAVLAKLRVNPENSGEAVAEFTERTPGGYRFHRDSPHVDTRIHVDMSEGQLLSLSHHRGVYYRATKPVVKPDAARLKAVTAYKKQGDRGQPEARTPELCYVLADDTFIRASGPPAYTLAYVFRFGKEEVWVDADNGSIITVFQNGKRVRKRRIGPGVSRDIGLWSVSPTISK